MPTADLTPPHIFEVSRALARELVDLYERFDGGSVPLIAYHASFLHRDRDGPWRDCGPHLRIDRADAADVPVRFRRWFLGAAYAIAIPEPVWRSIGERIIDFDSQGLTLVLKSKWDAPGIRPPPLIDRSFSDASQFALSPRMAALLQDAYEGNDRALVPTLVWYGARARRINGGPMVQFGAGFDIQFTSLYLIPPDCTGTTRGLPYAVKIPEHVLAAAVHRLLDCNDDGSEIVLR